MNKCGFCEESCGKDVRVSFCPKCNSRSVGYVFGFKNLFGVVPKMMCRSCGFDAPSFPILIANEVELKKAVGKMKKKRAKRKVASNKKGAKGR